MSRLIVAALLLLTASPSFAADAPTTRPAVRIVLVGDSTVTDKEGWGPGFKALLADDVECVNLALGGRSSKSYRDEGHWDKVLASKGDYVLIQFGHNDCPGKGPQRETDPKTTYRANMKRYVEEVRAAGMKPVLVTSLCRRNFDDAGKIQRSLQPYADVVVEIAKEMNVPLIDLHDRSVAACEKLGHEGCKPLSPLKADGTLDTTHLNKAGAKLFGQLVAEDLARCVPALAAHMRAASNSP